MGLKSEAQVLLLLILLLAIVALAVVKMHNIVKFESGLDKTEVLRGMWSKMHQVLLQPVKWPLALSILFGIGLRFAVEMIIETVLRIADVEGPPRAISGLAISLVCMSAGCFSAVLVYRLVGGRHPERCVAGCLGFSLLFYGLRVWTDRGPFSPIATVFWILGICLANVLCGMSAINWTLPLEPLQTAAAPSSISPLWWLWCVPLVGLTASVEIIHTKIDNHHYLERVCRSFSDLMLLVCCAFIATWCTNRAVMKGDYHWKWQSILISGLPVTSCELLAFAWNVHHGDPLPEAFRRHAVLSVVSGASGLLGSIFYLGVVAKYANAALDPGYEGQSELLDDNSDGSDFEV